MGQVILRLPATLQAALETEAEREGVELPQYILYALTRQIKLGYSARKLDSYEIAAQRVNFATLLERLGSFASDQAIDEFLAQREEVEPEPELSPQIMEQFRQRIFEARQSH